MAPDPAQPMNDLVCNVPPAELAVEAMAALGPHGVQRGELIYLRWISHDAPVWSATRLSTTTVVAGKNAVRQRIKDRTGL